MNMLAMQNKENLQKMSERCDALVAKLLPTDSLPFIEALGREFLQTHDILSMLVHFLISFLLRIGGEDSEDCLCRGRRGTKKKLHFSLTLHTLSLAARLSWISGQYRPCFRRRPFGMQVGSVSLCFETQIIK